MCLKPQAHHLNISRMLYWPIRIQRISIWCNITIGNNMQNWLNIYIILTIKIFTLNSQQYKREHVNYPLTRQLYVRDPHQLPLHILISRGTDEDGVLHETHETPECVALILDLRQKRSHQVWHALTVAHIWVKHGVVQQDTSGREIEQYNFS